MPGALRHLVLVFALAAAGALVAGSLPDRVEAATEPGEPAARPLPSSREVAPDDDRTPPPPVLPGVNADPHIAVFGDTFYLYPTTDGSEGWRSTSLRAWSSGDLVNWKDEGVILDLPRDLTWAKLHAWAPGIIPSCGFPGATNG